MPHKGPVMAACEAEKVERGILNLVTGPVFTGFPAMWDTFRDTLGYRCAIWKLPGGFSEGGFWPLAGGTGGSRALSISRWALKFFQQNHLALPLLPWWPLGTTQRDAIEIRSDGFAFMCWGRRCPGRSKWAVQTTGYWHDGLRGVCPCG